MTYPILTPVPYKDMSAEFKANYIIVKTHSYEAMCALFKTLTKRPESWFSVKDTIYGYYTVPKTEAEKVLTIDGVTQAPVDQGFIPRKLLQFRAP